MEIEDRLRGKIKFTEDLEDENRMSFRLLRRLMNEAEADVEQDLSPRYAAPFQTAEGAPFDQLPERPTKEFLRTLCELKTVLRVLETDFGRGAVDADDYRTKTDNRYKEMKNKLLELRNGDDQNKWLYPPLMGLRLGYHNTEADDGFRGMVINTSGEQGPGNYAANQINDPSKGWFNLTTEDIYGKGDV
jgi:hypothetical protein